MLPPRVRRIALTAHVTSSVGWLGAVVAYLALAITALVTLETATSSAAYVSMWIVASSVIIPFSLATMITGVIQSMGTEWGLFRHYWIATKLGLTVLGTIVLLLHAGTVREMEVAARSARLGEAATTVRVQLVVHAAGGLVVLLAATALSFFKPWGKIPRRAVAAFGEPRKTSWSTWIAVAAAGLVLLILALHAFGVRLH